MVLPYEIAEFGLNLHHSCHFALMMIEALSIWRAMQAAFRIRRKGQPYQQNIVHLNMEETYDRTYRKANVRKAFPQFAAMLGLKGDKEADLRYLRQVIDMYMGYANVGDFLDIVRED